MLSSIGKKPRQEASELVALLLECHERIRRFISLARVAGERADLPPSELADACARVERYFGQALPLHVADEEESILPRLRGLSFDVDRALDSMHDEHDEHAPKLRKLLGLCARLREQPEDGAARAELTALSSELEQEFAAHLTLEETVLFPALRQQLSDDQRAQIVAELRKRRGS